LRVIAGYASLLLDGSAGPLTPAQTDFVQRMAGSAARMQLLLDDLRTRSLGAVAAQPQDADLDELLEEVREDLGALLSEREARIEADGPLGHAWGDPIQVRQLLENLASNAVKFGPPLGGVVHVSAARGEGGVRVSVRDSGLGIAPEHHARIFEPFRRLRTGAEHPPGSGLGLAICEQIVAAHGGTLEVSSRPGKGATFSFTLPDRPG
jgi:signal transduction histidine kinase